MNNETLAQRDKDWPKEQLTQLGAKIRTARQSQGLTLKEVGDQVDLTASHISQLERGVTNPSVGALLQLAGVLDLPMEYFFSTTDDRGRIGSTIGPAIDELDPPAVETSLTAYRHMRGRAERTDIRPHSPADADPVIRHDAREVIKIAGGIEWRRLTPPHDNSVEFIELWYDVGAVGGDTAYMHQGREYGIVLQGLLKLELGFSTYLLEPGDSISFDCTIPHRLSNAGNEPVTGIWLILDRY